jgi:hypothetical protein
VPGGGCAMSSRDFYRAESMQEHMHRNQPRRNRPYDPDDPQRALRWRDFLVMDPARRGNYDSGEDFVLEYGELRFTFNEEDFAERCEQAAIKVGFVGGRLGEEELEDLVNLAVNGEISDPASALGQHVNDCWPELVGPAERSLVHWLRRLVFRGAWLDQRVNEGELTVAFDEESGSFSYVQPVDPLTAAGGEPIELAPEPSWGRVAYRG